MTKKQDIWQRITEAVHEAEHGQKQKWRIIRLYIMTQQIFTAVLHYYCQSFQTVYKHHKKLFIWLWWTVAIYLNRGDIKLKGIRQNHDRMDKPIYDCFTITVGDS